MKKILSVILVMTIILSTFAGLGISSSAADLPSSGSCGYNVTYTFDSSAGLLTISGSGAMKNYDNSAYSSSCSPFKNQSVIKTIVINSGVTSIGNSAFFGCSGLTSIIIPSSVTRISDSVFSGCKGLTSITIPNSVTSIGSSAFYDCSSLTAITIPSSVTSIGSFAFYGCNALTSITIPNSVTSISKYAFYDCSSLTSIDIPNSVTSIGASAFSGCRGLTSITIPNSITSIDYAFWGCTSLTSITVDSANPVYDSRGGCNAIIQTSTNTLIAGCKSTTIPNSVTNIGNSAFSGHSGLTSITIPNSVTSIGNSAFSGCSGLTSITIPNSVTSIGDNAFYKCSALTSITIPNSVTSIGGCAFESCSSLTSVTIGNSVTSIGNYAFRGCSGLTSITIPNSVTSIGDNAFYKCSALTSITMSNSITSIGGSVFDGTKVYQDSKNWENGVLYIGNYLIKAESLSGAYSVKPDTKAIAGSAFSGCTGLTSITIPDSVTSIGGFAFHYCSGLTSITIPDSITSISDFAFHYCIGLTSITIPNSVTSIGEESFGECTGLTNVKIPDSVVSIGKGAFLKCTGLNTIQISNSVTNIGEDVFFGCSGLTSVTIPNSVTSIGRSAFYNCSGLTSVTIPDSVTSIGEYSFYGCNSLMKITIPCSVTEIGCDAFTSNGVLRSFYYCGTQEQWDAIKIDDYSLKSQYIIFNSPLVTYSDTSLVAKSQTIKIIMSDDQGIDGYYWGNNKNYEFNSFKAVDNSLKQSIAYENVSNSGTFYLTVKDVENNISETKKIVFCRTDLEVSEGTVNPEYIVSESGKYLELPIPTSDKYIFKNWDGSQNSNLYLPLYSRTLWGWWAENYTINYESDSGTNIPSSQTKTEDVTLFLNSTKPSKSYTITYNANGGSVSSSSKSVSCTFNYWRATNGNTYNPGDAYTTNASTTLTAQWSNPSAGTLATPTRDYYIFDGWYTEESGGSKITSSSTITGNTILYAHWTYHTHNYIAKVTKTATCGESGVRTYTCSICGESYTRSISPTGNHSWNSGRVTKNPTCYAAGVKTFTCTVCNQTKTESVSMLPHTYTNVITKATTAKNGLITNKCSVCGEENGKTVIYYPKTIALSGTKYTYTGKVVTPKVSVKGSNGKVINSKNYTVTYAKGRKAVGRYAVKITFKGLYSGSVTKYFDIVPKGTAFSSVSSPKAKTIAIKWKKQSGISGYQVQLATNTAFTKGVKTYNAKASSLNAKISKAIKAKTNYYLRIRTFKTVKYGSKKLVLYSNWSKTVKVKTK